MIKLIVAAALALNLCATKAEVTESAIDWGSFEQGIPALIHVACDEPVLGRSTCTFYRQGYGAPPLNATCKKADIDACWNLRVAKPGKQIKP
jgi:hypothetical protein